MLKYNRAPRIPRTPKPPTVITNAILLDGRGGVIGAADVELTMDLYVRVNR